MATLYIDRRDAALDIENGALAARVGAERVALAPLAPLERVIVRGQATLSTRLIAALHGQGAGLLLLSGRRGEPVGTLLGRPHGDAAIRLGQTVLHLDAAARLALARATVRAKLSAQTRALARLAMPPGADRRALLAAQRGIPALAERLAGAADIAALSGLEGAAAALYFPALGAAFPAAFRFRTRSRRPPRDPANALLSLGYTLATYEAACAAAVAGLDPLVGFLHALAPHRPGLACDLVEPLRPRVDAWALGLVREGGLRADHFARDRDACLLGKAGRALVYRAWEDGGAPLLRRALTRICRRLARHCRAAALGRIPDLAGATQNEETVNGWPDSLP